MRRGLPDLPHTKFRRIGPRPGVERDGRRVDGHDSTLLHAEVKLRYYATIRDVDTGVLGRAGILAHRYPTRPVEPQRNSIGLQLPGAGGVNDGNVVFRSGAGDAKGACFFCAGESHRADASSL